MTLTNKVVMDLCMMIAAHGYKNIAAQAMGSTGQLWAGDIASRGLTENGQTANNNGFLAQCGQGIVQ
jgi:hypothetical protein